MEHESKVKKILFNEISLAMSIIGVTLAVAFWVVNPQTELEKQLIRLQAQTESNEQVATALEKIKNNDLHEMQLRMDRMESRQIEQLQAIARIEALLSKK